MNRTNTTAPDLIPLVQASLELVAGHDAASGVTRLVPESSTSHWALHSIDDGVRPLSYVTVHEHPDEAEVNVFLGDMFVEVLLGSSVRSQVTPFMVEIPPGMLHGFSIISGKGMMLCHRNRIVR